MLSFVIPGLGQIYKGQIGRGLIFLPITIAGYAMLILPGVIIHIFVILDAYNSSTLPHPGASSPRVAVELTPEQRERQKAQNRKSAFQMLWIAIGLAVVLLLSVLFAPARRPYQRSTTTSPASAASAEIADSEEWETRLKEIVKSAGQPPPDHGTRFPWALKHHRLLRLLPEGDLATVPRPDRAEQKRLSVRVVSRLVSRHADPEGVSPVAHAACQWSRCRQPE